MKLLLKKLTATTIAEKNLIAHEEFSAQSSLPMVFGDGYCFSKSDIFKKVRQLVIGFGVNLKPISTSDEVELYYSNLNNLVSVVFDRETIFYWPNSRKVTELFTMYSDTDISMADLLGSANRNTILHESVHFVCQKIRPLNYKVKPPASAKQFIIANLEAEALSVTTEVMAASQLGTEDGLELAYPNFFMVPSVNFMNLIRGLTDRFGTKSVFDFIYYAYLLSMKSIDIYKPATDAAQMLTSNYKDLSQNELELFTAVLEYCFRLNPYFKKRTNKFFFHQFGISNSIEIIQSLDFKKDFLDTNESEKLKNQYLELIDIKK